MIDNILTFLRAATPWISLGLLIAFLCVRPAIRKAETGSGDYAAEGMCIGMCVGMACGSLIGSNNGGLGTSLGMLVGLAIGLCVPRKNGSGKADGSGTT